MEALLFISCIIIFFGILTFNWFYGWKVIKRSFNDSEEKEDLDVPMTWYIGTLILGFHWLTVAYYTGYNKKHQELFKYVGVSTATILLAFLILFVPFLLLMP